VLIVDEVLAVGDAKFQARCLGKMGQVASEGRTVVFVSHNMSAITNFCPRSIWLERGSMRDFGKTSDIVSRYLSEGGDRSGSVVFAPEDRPGSDAARLMSVRTLNGAGEPVNLIGANEALTVEVEYETLRRTSGLRIGVTLLGRDGEAILSTKDLDAYPSDYVREAGRYVSRCTLPGDFLNAGKFFITVGSDIPMVQANFNADRVLSFSVEMASDSVGGHVPDGRVGLLRMQLPWSVERLA
jgi:lipopolysaccharide transport system ATP-binding protein